MSPNKTIKQKIPPKHRYTYTRLHGVTSRTTVPLTDTPVKISNHQLNLRGQIPDLQKHSGVRSEPDTQSVKLDVACFSETLITLQDDTVPKPTKKTQLCKPENLYM